MNKIKSTMIAIKNDIKDRPIDYAVAVALGITAGVLTTKYLTSKEEGEKDAELYLPESIKSALIETTSYFRFTSPEGDFALVHIKPE